MGSGKAYLVSVAGVSRGGLGRNHALGQFAWDGVGDFCGNVSCSGHAHGLIHIGPAGKGIPNGSAQAGGGTSEWLNLSGVVVGLVLEHEEPFLHLPVHIDVHEDAAGVVLLALLLVVQEAFRLEIACSYGGQFHQAQRFMLAPEAAAHLAEKLERVFQFAFEKRLVDGYFLYL